MKKLFLLFITIITLVISLTTSTFATYIPVTNGNTGMWFTDTEVNSETVKLVNFRVKQIWGDEKTNLYGFTILFNTEFETSQLNKSYSINKPNNQYSTIVIEKYDYTNLPHREPTVHYTGVVESIKLVIDSNGYITLKNQDDQYLFSDFDTYAIKVYFKSTAVIPGDISDFITYGELPITTDGNLGVVLFSVENYQVIVTIWYDDINYNMKYNFSPLTDMTLFSETNEAYYINLGGKPQIFINQSNSLYLRDILSAQSDAKPAFVPHVIWDLQTNTLTNVNKYNAHVFIKQNNKGVIIAYYYVDEFIIDRILSTTLTYTSRNVYSNFGGLWTDKKPWETHQWSYTNEETLIYKDKTSSWQQWIPIYNFVFLGIRLNQTFEMPRIEAVNFNEVQDYYNVTKTELETEFMTKTPNFATIKNNSRYKVWAFALEDGASFNGGILGTVQTEFYNTDDQSDVRNLKVIEIVYQTDEKIYTTVGNHMNLVISVETKLDGIAKEEEQPDILKLILIVALVFVVIYIFTTVFNVSRVVYRPSRRRNNSIPLIITIFIISFVILLIYIFLTQGSFF